LNVKPEVKRLRGRPRSRWEGDNIKMGFNDIGLRVWTRFIRLRIRTRGRFL
jgi:hypothetical protein